MYMYLCIYLCIYLTFIYPTTVINEFCAVVTDVAIDLSCQSCL